MKRAKIVLLKIVLLMMGALVLATSAWSQAVAEYGMATSHSGVAAARTGSVFSNVDGKLSQQAAGRSAKSLDQAMRENRRALESKAERSGATLHVASAPDKANVIVDGGIVAQTPAKLRVPVGAHVIELHRAGYITWRKQVALIDGQMLSLQPKLEEKYKSTVNLGSR